MEQLPVETIARIDRFSTEAHICAGRVLMRQGSPGREAYIVVDGTAAVRRDGRLVATVSSGSIVGETAVLHGGGRTADVIALTDMTLLVSTPAELSSLCADDSFLAWLNQQVDARTAAQELVIEYPAPTSTAAATTNRSLSAVPETC
jgi:CRP-like cAMP-binding protein